MKIRIYLIKRLVLMISSVILFSCTEVNTKSSHPSLNESEIFFSELLASISPDVFNKSMFYVGTEDGIVYEYDSDVNKVVRHFKTDADRIYKVVRDDNNGDTIFWLGTRNQGLWRCQLRGDSLVRMRSYFIPTTDKGTKYSAYDITIQKTGIYVGTSHGLLKVPADTTTTDFLEIVAPASLRSRPELLCPVVAGNILVIDTNTIFCASDSGLWKIDMRDADYVSTTLAKRKVWNVTQKDGRICALTDRRMQIIDIEYNKVVDSVILKGPSQYLYYEENQKVNYLFTENEVQIVQDKHLHLSQKKYYHNVKLRRPIRTKCHNIIVNDVPHEQSLMLTDHAIIRLGHHQDILNPMNAAVAHATTDNNFIYYQINHQLFQQKAGDSIAHHIKNFPKNLTIRHMEILNGKLYYVSEDNRLFQSTIHSKYIINTLFSLFGDKQVGNIDMQREATAIGKNNNEVYIGVRDGFRCVSNPDKDIQVLSASGETILNPFVTAFATTNNDKVIFGTLNDGIYIGHDTIFQQRPNSDTYTFIRDIALKPGSERDLYVLTNHNLYGLDDMTTWPNRDFRKLLIPDTCHVFAIGSFGLHDFKDSTATKYFPDIIFNPSASVVCDGIIYASSSCGVYMLPPSFSKEGYYKEITFLSKQWLSMTNIIIILSVLIIIVLTMGIDFHHKKAFQEWVKSVVKSLDELKPLLKKPLQHEIENLVIDGKANDKGIITNRLMGLQERVTLEITTALEKQIISLDKMKKSAEIQGLIKQSKDVFKKSNDLCQIVEQIRKNHQFFSENKVLEFFTEMFYSKNPWAINIYDANSTEKKEGIACDGDPKAIFSSDKNTAEKIEELNKLISSHLNKDDIGSYVETKKTEALKANGRSNFDYDPIADAYEAIYQKLKISDNVFRLLKEIFYSNQRLFMLNQLDEIEKGIEEYEKLQKGRDIVEKGNIVQKTVRKAVHDFCECLVNSPDGILLQNIGLSDKGKMQWRWIPLLLVPTANNLPDQTKYSFMDNDPNASSFSRAKHGLVEFIKSNRSFLAEKMAECPSSLIHLIISSIRLKPTRS